MKKWMALLMFLCLLPCMGTAENNNPAKAAVVANQNVADRLILRSAPTKNGKVLGRFYSGTPVIILEDDGSWCRVQIGSLTGYMMRPYLADELPNYDLPQLFFDASVKKTNAPIYSKASTSSPVIARASDTIKLLGDINDDWRYVKCGEQYGYMRALHLYETEINLETAYLSSRVELCSDPGLKKHTGAIYYANTPVRVVAISRKEGWAKVEITGFPGVSDGLGPSGYIRQEYLNVFVWPGKPMTAPSVSAVFCRPWLCPCRTPEQKRFRHKRAPWSPSSVKHRMPGTFCTTILRPWLTSA